MFQPQLRVKSVDFKSPVSQRHCWWLPSEHENFHDGLDRSYSKKPEIHRTSYRIQIEQKESLPTAIKHNNLELLIKKSTEL